MKLFRLGLPILLLVFLFRWDDVYTLSRVLGVRASDRQGIVPGRPLAEVIA